MKKLFLSICFISAVSCFQNIRAEIINVDSPAEIQKREMTPPPAAEDPRLPDLSDQDSVAEFIKKRFQNDNLIIDASFDEESLSKASSLNIQHSEEYIKQIEEGQKSTFEKIYDNALRRMSREEQEQNLSAEKDRKILLWNNRSERQTQKRQSSAGQKPDFPVIDITLPDNKTKIMVPALEHIPYMFSDIEILPTGQINIEETIMVVANGKKLRNGLSRALPIYARSRTGKIKPIDYNLGKVSVNGTEIPHKIKKIGRQIVITPAKDYTLQPGVYTYTFNYVINRNIWDYGNFHEFYWNITGSSWNMVVSRIGAIVTLPGKEKPLGLIALRGYPGSMKDDVSIVRGEGNAVGFISTVPLFIGEGLHIIISMSGTDFFSPGFSQKFSWFLSDYGDIFISLFMLAAICLSYFLSWKSAAVEKGRQKYNLKKNAPLLRYLALEKFDKISFGSFLLELFKKGLIDFEKQNETFKLIKKKDSLKGLDADEKKTLKALFPGRETSLDINRENSLKIKRAYQCAAVGTKKRFRLFSFRINAIYLIFGTGMLILGETAVSRLQLNPEQTLSTLLGGTVVLFALLLLFRLKPRWKFFNICCKTFCTAAILCCLTAMWPPVHFFSVLCILGAVIVILSYAKLFVRREGLLRQTIEEAKNYGAFLLNHREELQNSRHFLNRQAEILAAEVQEHFPQTAALEKVYRLDIVNEILQKL